jgi:alanine-synthesizing transaminase
MVPGMTFSSRVPRAAAVNTLTRTLAAQRDQGVAIADLTTSNPTRVGLPYPDDLLAALADTAALQYDPDPRGLRAAREAIAADMVRRGAHVAPDRVVLSASTSEAYSWLFKLLCDPGDGVLVPHPSYPLFEHLARAEGVRVQPYGLDFHGRWDVDLASVEAAPAGTKALVVVSPNNPTGSYLGDGEAQALFAVCERRGWALVVDEVFADYALEVESPTTDWATRAPVLTFSLGGASKSIGLPQVKLGWMVVGGPEPLVRAALDGLDYLADTYLSVSTPVQVAAPRLLMRGALVRLAIHDRIRENLSHARRLVAAHPACTLLPVEGGWTAVLRVPAVQSEESLVLGLLQDERVLVHPGYFFDFDHEAYLIVSLLPPPMVFTDALERTLRYACGVS